MINQTNNNAGDDNMKKAYRLAKNLLKDRLNNEDKDLLENIDQTDVVVVSGTYDHIHLVLKHLNLPFVEVNHNQFLGVNLKPDQTVFVNCASSFPPEGARKLATFVSQGGQLITTDWALKNVLEVGFPNTVAYNGKPTADEVVRIELLDREDPVIAGFLDEETDPVWWLEGSSYPVKILDKEKVQVLMRSKELGEKYGDDAVIIRFNHGEGVVYHMISHFYLQRTETREAKQTDGSTNYAMSKGASAETMAEFSAEEDVNYGEVQSASTSAEFVSRAILKQKKKWGKKK
ncbi:MAG TPA: hypothetical protein DCS93_12480 [Microscillaceae bacterium]|nr:hypothetical protein [Microscillaceae bacterium]